MWQVPRSTEHFQPPTLQTEGNCCKCDMCNYHRHYQNITTNNTTVIPFIQTFIHTIELTFHGSSGLFSSLN